MTTRKPKRLQNMTEMPSDSALSTIRWAIQLCAGRTTNSIICERRAEAVLSFITTIIHSYSSTTHCFAVIRLLEFYASRITSETAR